VGPGLLRLASWGAFAYLARRPDVQWGLPEGFGVTEG
jgi:hypothetical protein